MTIRKKIWRTVKKISVSEWIATAALAVTIVFGIRSCTRDRQVDEIQYRLSAIQAQPRLKIVGQPEIIDFAMRPIEFDLDSALAKAKPGADGIPTSELPTTIKVISKVRFTNVGNSVAKCFAYAQATSLSEKAMLRDMMLDLKRFSDGIRLTAIDRANELLPGDTTDLEFENDVLFVDKSRFVVHYLILYVNDLGMLYDTYVWTSFNIGSASFLYHLSYRDGRPFIDGVRLESPGLNSIIPSVQDVNDSYWSYGHRDFKEIQAVFRDILHQQERSVP